MGRIFTCGISLCLMFSHFAVAETISKFVNPDRVATPGKICTEKDPDFMRWDYGGRVARCNRHVKDSEKVRVAEHYRIPRPQWSDYEFDHLIPLCAGGSNNEENIWPQILVEAKNKDKVENEVCRALTNGTMTQKQAIARIWAWFNQKAIELEASER